MIFDTRRVSEVTALAPWSPTALVSSSVGRMPPRRHSFHGAELRASAIWSLRDPRVVPGFRWPFLLGMPLSMTPGSSIIVWSRTSMPISPSPRSERLGTPSLPAIRRGARLSGLPDSHICYGLYFQAFNESPEVALGRCAPRWRQHGRYRGCFGPHVVLGSGHRLAEAAAVSAIANGSQHSHERNQPPDCTLAVGVGAIIRQRSGWARLRFAAPRWTTSNPGQEPHPCVLPTGRLLALRALPPCAYDRVRVAASSSKAGGRVFRIRRPVTLRDDLCSVTVLNAILRVELPGDLVRRTPDHWVGTKSNHLIARIDAYHFEWKIIEHGSTPSCFGH
jgi:hypothetical protein